MAADLPQAFDPLQMKQAGPAELAAHSRNIVKNVLDSYTGRFDVLAEAVQNSMDALEARWGAGLEKASSRLEGEVPTLLVRLDSVTNEITVIDNGTGITGDRLQKVFTPHLSPKMLEGGPTRGHKGVGTTFLLYGHPAFTVWTKADDGQLNGYELLGGSDWILSPVESPAPQLKRIDSPTHVLDAFGLGTSMSVKVDEDTRFGRLKNAQYNKIETWELVLRTYTAIGVIDIGKSDHRRPDWQKALQVKLELINAASITSKRTIEPKFKYPHEGAATSVSLGQLWTKSVPASQRYDMLYVELTKDELERNLQSAIEELENSDNPEQLNWAQTLRKYDTEVYAAWSYKNTLYEDIYRDEIDEPQAKRYPYMNLKGGLLVSSVGMAVGETGDHPYAVMKPEFRRRLFVLVSFNDKYAPDLGRKTIPSKDRAFLDWLERQIQGLFLPLTGRLVKSNDEAPHKAGDYAQAKEELGEAADKMRKAASGTRLAQELGFMTQPKYESELVGLFYASLASGRLPGYELISVPGSRTRLDGLFDYSTTVPDSPTAERTVPLGIAGSRFKTGSFSRKSKWLEFKVRLVDLVDDLEADDATDSKKYFDLIDLAVVWDAPDEEAISDYDLSRVNVHNWNERDYHGVTHFLRRGGSNHTVQVLALRDYLASSLSGPDSDLSAE